MELENNTTHRRGFLGRVAAGAAALGLGSLVAPLEAAARPGTARAAASADPAFEAWLDKIVGKHKMVYDMPEPNSGFGLVWSRVLLDTTNQTYGTTDADNKVVVVLRHAAIPFGMKDTMWAKYKFGETFNITDSATKAPAVKNGFLNMKPGSFPIAGVGIDELLAAGVLVGICNLALTFYSMDVAAKMKLDAAAVKQDWVAHLVPGVLVVPSGVIAVNRAQEKGCAYCFAG